MANTRISDLSAGGVFIGTDIFPVVETVAVGPVKKTGSQLQEFVEDTVGTGLLDSSTIDFTYDDVAGTFTAIVKNNSIGSAQIDETDDAAIRSELALTETLSADRTYFVNDTTGNDTNDGLSSGAPFKTVQKGIDIAAGLNLAGFTVTISVADDTYNEDLVFKTQPTGVVSLQGNTTTPANCVVNASALTVFASGIIGSYVMQGFEVIAPSTGQNFTILDCTITFRFGNMVFNGAQRHINMRGPNTFLEVIGNYEMKGNANWHILASNRATLNSGIFTVTVTGTPAFAVAFVATSRNASVLYSAVTFSGAATGKRYSGVIASLIDSGAGGANFFPGDAAGTVDASSVYN